jgi:hypothetical protein
MKDFGWASYWLFLIWFTLQIDGCVPTDGDKQILKELKEIKQEIRNER